ILSTNPDPKAIGYDVGVTNGGLYSAQINVEKNIFNGGLSTALERQIEIQQQQLSFNSILEQKNIKKQITVQYLTAYQSLLFYQLSKDILDNISAQLKITGALVEKGFLKAQDYLLLKIEVQNQQISLSENLQKYKNDLFQLNSFCGIKDTQLVFIDSVQIQMNKSKPRFDFLEKYRIDSMITSNQQELFESKYQPQVKLFFNTGLNATEINEIQRKFGLSAGIDFQMPIFDGGQRDLTRQQVLVSINSIDNYKKFESNNIENELQTTISNIKLLQHNLDNIKNQLNDYNELINISVKQVNSGNLSMIEYLTVIKNYFELKKNKIEKEITLQMEANNYNYWIE
ncbi:MAG TPA: TolC family protein, partial [Ignavibacteriaceae bacterium]|nr:TolC family protein [Ignavibacteriaceae bacterium]